MAEFEGRVALVTGASSGIGRTAAVLFARHGAQVVASDVNEAGGKETVQMIGDAGGEAIFVRADVSKPSDCEAQVETALQNFGRLDYAFNNAGISGEMNLVADYSVESWERVIGINLSGVFYCMKYQIPAMLQAGGGVIVNNSSILGKVATQTVAAYIASKHGVIGLTQAAALDYAAQGIRINAIGPGYIRTAMTEVLEQDPQTAERLIAMHPIGRFGEPEEVAEMALWLCSEKASFVTGAYFPVDGGYLAR